MRLTLLASGFVLLLTGAALASETVTYTYDARGRLVEVSHSGGPANATKIRYEYDDVGNIKRRKVTGA